MIMRRGCPPQIDHAALDAALSTHASVCRLDAFPAVCSPEAGVLGAMPGPAASSTSYGQQQSAQSEPFAQRNIVSNASSSVLVSTAVSASDMAALAATLAQDLYDGSEGSSDSEEFDS